MLSFIDPAGLLFAGALVGVVIIGALIVVRPVAADALLYQAKVTRNCVVMSAIESKSATADAPA
ncbi:hypothetical protein [Rhizobium esperanzae]|uniref:Uncharacterized protein n=1 Tax=Rhizobium esperanzae TaxID=1967781 RepID=A0A7W6W415_9HYPH|nr:hypothetical protein [Rhizobium esperanzae]MBB4234836.1 hypothetical protein [Rhizobium esperanzae]